MSKCKRCHAPDELNGIGLCKHCTAFIKNDVKENKERLARIYDQFPEGADLLDDARKADLLRETQDIFDLLDRYQHMGFPVGSYIMPARKILHFLDPGGEAERRILLKQRRRAGVTAIICAAMAAAFAVTAVMLGNQPLPVKPGNAVSVSASVEEDMDRAGMDAGFEGQEGESPADGSAGKENGEAVSGGGEEKEEASGDGDSGAQDEEASGGEENSGEENGDAAPAAEQAAPRVSARASGGTVVIGGGRAVAIPAAG